MMAGQLKPLAALLVLPFASAAAPVEDYAEPYRILRQANQSLDPALATSAYASDGELIFEIAGKPAETFRGSEAIRRAYVRTFGQVDPGSSIGIDFRFDAPGLTGVEQEGAYRLAATVGGRAITLYGRFSVRLVKQQRHWRFAQDRGTVASEADFSALPPANL